MPTDFSSNLIDKVSDLLEANGVCPEAVCDVAEVLLAYDGALDTKPEWSIIIVHSSGNKVIGGFTGHLSAIDFCQRHLSALETKVVQQSHKEVIL